MKRTNDGLVVHLTLLLAVLALGFLIYFKVIYPAQARCRERGGEPLTDRYGQTVCFNARTP